MIPTVGMKIKYYPALKDSRYFMFRITEGDSYDGYVMEVNIITNLAKINVRATPVMTLNFNDIPVYEILPVNPTAYGFAVKA